MNDTRRNPTTGRQSPSLLDKWHGVFNMPSRTDTAGHTEAFDYPVAEHWREPKCSVTGVGLVLVIEVTGMILDTVRSLMHKTMDYRSIVRACQMSGAHHVVGLSNSSMEA